MIGLPVQVFLTPSHLGIVLEYAKGGELFQEVVDRMCLSEDSARYYFQQVGGQLMLDLKTDSAGGPLSLHPNHLGLGSGLEFVI
jgi:serine/threonine protein kinase